MSDMIHHNFSDPLEAKAMIIANADKPVIKYHCYAMWQRRVDKPYSYDPQFSTFVRCDASALCDIIDEALASRELHQNYEFINKTWTFAFSVAVSTTHLILNIKSTEDDPTEEE